MALHDGYFVYDGLCNVLFFWGFVMFKRGLLAVGICALLAGCGSDSGTTSAASADVAKPASEAVKSSTSYTYKITADEVMGDNIKRTVKIDLSERVTEQQLKELAQKIKDEDKKTYNIVHLQFFVPDWTTGAWAVVNFNPEISVSFVGSKKEEHDALAKIQPVAKGDLIGKWHWLYGYETKIVIEKQNGKTVMREICPSGEENQDTLSVRKKDGKTTYATEANDDHGEYYVINKDGDLEFWTNEKGLRYTGKKLP